ncbi:hypothetical protein ACSBR2_037332 [Camellia fascicularis]
MSSNAAESFNNWIKEARHLSITRLVDAIRIQIMNQLADCRGASSTWTRIICLKMESKLDKRHRSEWVVDPYLHVVNYRTSYSHTIYPIPTVEKPEINLDKIVILPSAVRRPPGRPKKKRIPSQGEEVQQIRCGRCGRMGNHNRTTCMEPM